MLGFRKIKNCFTISYKIMDSYNCLLELLISDYINTTKINCIFDSIKKDSLIEEKRYSKLSLEDIKYMADLYKDIPRDMFSMKDIRVTKRLSLEYDKRTGMTFNNYGLFKYIDYDDVMSVSDIINSKIIIDVFLLVQKKLLNLVCSNQNDRDFVQRMLSLHKQHSLYKLSLYYLSEKIAIENAFDLDKIKSINLGDVEKNISLQHIKKINLKDLSRKNIFSELMLFLNSFEEMNLNPSDEENIYDNLYFVSYIEILLPYLLDTDIEFLSKYCDSIRFKNDLVGQNIKTLIRQNIKR